MAVGIVERGRRRVIVYGTQDSRDARSVAANTLFEIGSLTKVFTALLLADMVDRGKSSLTIPSIPIYPPDLSRRKATGGRSRLRI